ncbi:MAG: hypothetical protein ACI9X4_001184 [Glaciecola sp.]|jgi:hypothetical protein
MEGFAGMDMRFLAKFSIPDALLVAHNHATALVSSL